MRIAVVGAGWAGLSAACRLHADGHQLTVFEAGHTLGGRARTVQAPGLGCATDNGQHLLLGAYDATLALMRDLGRPVEHLLHELPLTLVAADGGFTLRASTAWRALAMPAALLGAGGLSMRERLALILLMARLRCAGWRTPPGQTVRELLTRHGQSDHVQRRLWEPLCLAAMNTPPERACAQLFAHVLRDSVGGGARASRMLIPRCGLSDLWPEHMPAALTVRRGHTVRALQAHAQGVTVDGLPFDAVVVATPPVSALRLLRQLPACEGSAAYLEMLSGFEPLPIATLTLKLAHPWGLPHAVLMLQDDPAKQAYGQWLFNPAAYGPATPQNTAQPCLVHVVISHATDLQQMPAAQAAQAVLEQLQTQTGHLAALPPVLSHVLIVEKRATFAAVPGLARPANLTPWRRVAVAGDWTDTGYPAVLEGAVRSGLQAARLLPQAISPSVSGPARA